MGILTIIVLSIWSLTFLSVAQRKGVAVTVLQVSSETETRLANLAKGLRQLKQQITERW